jgi:hypothetical protein
LFNLKYFEIIGIKLTGSLIEELNNQVHYIFKLRGDMLFLNGMRQAKQQTLLVGIMSIR